MTSNVSFYSTDKHVYVEAHQSGPVGIVVLILSIVGLIVTAFLALSTVLVFILSIAREAAGGRQFGLVDNVVFVLVTLVIGYVSFVIFRKGLWLTFGKEIIRIDGETVQHRLVAPMMRRHVVHPTPEVRNIRLPLSGDPESRRNTIAFSVKGRTHGMGRSLSHCDAERVITMAREINPMFGLEPITARSSDPRPTNTLGNQS